MKHIENGVSEESYINFTLPSEFARKALYCCTQSGHFYCVSGYDVRRIYYDWYLLVYVCRGGLSFETGGQNYTAKQDQVVLLDCHAPHRYYCDSSAEFMWFHFYGNNTKDYTEYLYAQNASAGIVFSGDQTRNLRPLFSDILRQTGFTFVNEHLISQSIGTILSSIAAQQKNAPHQTMKIAPAIDHIFSHFAEPIDLDQMARLCMLSKPHFIRCFKKSMDCTPHDFLLDYRLREAQKMLSDTSFSIEEIAEHCGFNSISHFSRAFKSRITMTPSEFREMW